MSKKQVWFSLPVDSSPDTTAGAEDSPVFQYREFSLLRDCSGSTDESDLSQYSFKSPQKSNLTAEDLSQYSIKGLQKSNQTSEELSQYSFKSPQKSNLSAADLSQYSVKSVQKSNQTSGKLSEYSFKSPQKSNLTAAELSQYSFPRSMEQNNTAETYSTNDSQDISTSQQESTASDGQYGYDDGNDSSSLRDSPHEEVVNSAIMEVSGELMLGKLTPNKHPSVGSESSDISDDDVRIHGHGGSIAKYPESSTGLSDNDWNPYVTESDTNQTPRSPRSANSDDNRVGFISKANINVKALVSERVEKTDDINREKLVNDALDKALGRVEAGVSVSDSFSPEPSRSDNEDVKQYATMLSEREDLERESPDTAPDTARSAYTEESRSGRQSSDSLRSDEYKRDSMDYHSAQSELGSARHSLESGPLESLEPTRRISTESAKSLSHESGDNSSQPSVETVRNMRASQDDGERMTESFHSGRQSIDSHSSHRSDGSRKTDQLNGYRVSSSSSGRSDRLEKLSYAAGDNLKELMQFESAQRSTSSRNDDKELQIRKDRRDDTVSSTRLTAKVEAYQPKDRNLTGYVPVYERERLIADSPVLDMPRNQNPVERRSYDFDKSADHKERSKPIHSEVNIPDKTPEAFGRSPSEVSMRRVSNLFEETKRQVREAVAIPRPDPSGSEERFPLRERLTWNQHDASFIPQAANRSAELEDKQGEKVEKSRESEAARSLTSEEVARVLSKYSEYEKEKSPVTSTDLKLDTDNMIKVSAFDTIDKSLPNGHANGTLTNGTLTNGVHVNGTTDVSDDELSKRVKAILADSHNYDRNRDIPVRESNREVDYVPNTIDYTRLHRDLEEIQDSLHDIPKPKANDSLPLHLRNGTDYQDSPVPPEFVIKSMETTSSGVSKSRESGISEYNGRESGVSEYGRRLVWDHGADLQYDPEYDGKFLGTNTSTDTLSHGRKRYSSDGSDTLVVRPDSVATNATEFDVGDFESDGTRTLTGTQDITRAERIVQQVMNRQAEGDLKENVEDIIARYRDERKDLQDRFQSGDSGHITDAFHQKPRNCSLEQAAVTRFSLKSNDLQDRFQSGDSGHITDMPETRNHLPVNGSTPAVTTSINKPVDNPGRLGLVNPGKDQKEMGLAERVYKILTADTDNPYDLPDEQGDRSMASTVSNILAKGNPKEQVNGILTKALVEENEMLKKITTRETPKMTDSSLDDSGVNETDESYALEDGDIRKRLQWSQMSSPDKIDKGDKSYLSDWNALREVTKAPYSSVNNAKSLLSTQLKKMSERNFDKSVELRTPYRQTIQCYPIHGVERTGDQQAAIREAWVPRVGTSQLDRDRNPVGSERFYLTDKDQSVVSRRHRTYSDPFDVSQTGFNSQLDRDPHPRSRSEEPHDVSDLSQYSELPREHSPTGRRAASSPTRSEEPHDVSDLSEYSELPREHSPTGRRAASSPTRLSGRGMVEHVTPNPHKPEAPSRTKLSIIVKSTESWSYEYYTASLSDSSDPRYHSDSSGCHGNKWHFHSPDKMADPENDVYNKFQRASPFKPYDKFSMRTNKSKEDLVMSPNIDNISTNRQTRFKQEKSLVSQGFRSQSPVKMLNEKQFAVGHQSRSRTRQKFHSVKFNTPISSSDTGPHTVSEFSERQLINRIAKRKDDVYDLLTDRGQRELNVRELKDKLTDLQKERAYSKNLPFENYGNDTNAMASNHGKMPKYMNRRYARPVISPTDSDTSGSRKAASRPRPYRPAGSRDMYYTESGEDTNESGTTVESTHPGSDDAIPPYIPRQYLGTRQEEPNKHPTGIYCANDKNDGLSTIDEQSVKDDKEKALSASTGSNKEQTDRQMASDSKTKTNFGTQFTETGYQTQSVVDNQSGVPAARNYDSRSRSSSNIDLEKGQGYPLRGEESNQQLKSREEYLREFEQRELGKSKDPMGTSVRSDPGGSLEDAGARWEYRESIEPREFRMLEPEPGYPQDRLRYSRSRSDTDLVALSPAESQRYSSPMQPGTRFMELSTQPSPIYHQDSLTIPHRQRASNDQDEPRLAPAGRHSPMELPHVDDRRQAPELPRVDDRRASPAQSYIRDSRPPRPLDPGQEPVRPLEPGEVMDPVDLGADPGRLGDIPRSSRPRTPVYAREKEMEAELEKMNKELSEQVKEIQEGPKPEEKDEDRTPLSKKAQILRQVLEQEYVEGIPPNINDMWTRFKEKFDQSVSESSLNSTRLDALSGLIHNPTHHMVNSFIKEKDQEAETQKKLSEDKAEKIREERKQESERLKKMAEKRAVEERSVRRQELRQKHGLSEEESNGSITEILVENEKRKERSKKKERRSDESASPKKRKTPDKERREKKGKKNAVDKETETNIKSRPRVTKPGHSDSMDTLFSIPEDASFEHSPTKLESELRSRQRRQRHVIDPLMKKLRDKIKLQRDKIDKERRKELQRVEKLKKLEMLLTAKRRNQLSDKAIDVELQNVSTTTSVHSESTLMSTDGTVHQTMSSQDSEHSDDISTTLKDSTGTPIKLQVKRYPELEQRGYKHNNYAETDSTESSDFSNIIVEKLPQSQSGKARKSDRKSGNKDRKVRLDENGQRIRKEKKGGKKKKEVFGVELSDEDLERQLRRYERYVSPDRHKQTRGASPVSQNRRRVSPDSQNRRGNSPVSQNRRGVSPVSPSRHKQLRDASTMYPSPITVSPPQRRRIRDVLMRSEAIQTSPSVRSTSPSYSYDEVPVAPVPTMSSITSSKRSLQRRPSPSPTRSTSSRSAKTSTSPPRKTSKSPTGRKSSSSPNRPPTGGRVQFPPSTRGKDPPMWKPESEDTPLENSMFTPEVDENVKPASTNEATSWFIPMKPGQPWRQPLKERQAFSVRQEQWEPKSISQKQWKKFINTDLGGQDQGDQNDVSRDTKFDLDPEGQPMNDESGEEESDIDLDLSNSKPVSKMSLQEAFMYRKQMTISRLRERQKRLNLAAEQRRMEAYLKMERDRLFSEERKKEANPEAHPYSDNLYRPARRVISKEEMKEMTTKRYKKLPEVVEREKLRKRQEDYNLNRLKARLFNRKIQKNVLVKAQKWGS